MYGKKAELKEAEAELKEANTNHIVAKQAVKEAETEWEKWLDVCYKLC